MKVKLVKLNSTHERLRTPTVKGTCTKLPVVGKRFKLIGEGITIGLRYVETSIVKAVSEITKDVWLFTTEYSQYKLERME